MSRFFLILALLAVTSSANAYSNEDVICLARNIYWEARGESYLGQVAVGQITLNRVRVGVKGGYKSTVCGVVYQRTGRTHQFSWTKNIGSISEVDAYIAALRISQKMLSGKISIPGLYSSMHYHADYVSPGWRYALIGKIGKHLFYT